MLGKIRKFSKKLFANKYTDLIVILIIFFSILLLAVEAIFQTLFAPEAKILLLYIDDAILIFFVIELTLRYFSCDNFKDFIRKYWLDILAVIPLFRVFRMARIFRLFRLFRIVSLAVLIGRHMSFFSSIFSKRWLDFILILIILLFVIVFGTIGIRIVEKEPVLVVTEQTIDILKEKISYRKLAHLSHLTGKEFNEESLIKRLEDIQFEEEEIDMVLNYSEENLRSELDHAFWTTIYTLSMGEYASQLPETIMGKIIILIIMFSGMGVFAILLGASTAVMMDMFKEGISNRKTNFDILENHIIICGWWDEQTSRVIKELQASEEYKNTSIVIISDKKDFGSTDLKSLGIKMGCIFLIEGDFTDPSVLKNANIDNAKIAIILADKAGERSQRDMDARTVLASLTIEKLNAKVYTCAELLDPEYESHMALGQVNQVVVGGYFSGLITANAAVNENLIPFIYNTIRSKADNRFQNIELPEALRGKEFREIITEMREKYKILPLGVKSVEGKLVLNPRNYILKKGDLLIGLVNKKTEKNNVRVIKNFHTTDLAQIINKEKKV